jgi:hypothetical protein
MLIWEISADMTQVSDVGPRHLFFSGEGSFFYVFRKQINKKMIRLYKYGTFITSKWKRPIKLDV